MTQVKLLAVPGVEPSSLTCPAGWRFPDQLAENRFEVCYSDIGGISC